ncbi:HD domain-containing protein [Amphritea pacifica]|uniref:HD domain-containing protein n=1 Tax=Amphritea pacifica TaxID=2811233 RepID=A0ABS2W951_9GAMM|nr:HD domain-containing protein [Amphritea pacifica]MBN0988246.1 HD domain-containing protein [Amphritea pacifica]MBN1008688.1 HD domain-containing protein [Amphritea pacifica]
MTDILSNIEQIYNEMGHNHYGEGVSQIEHAVQCARLAVEDGERADMVVAALLHDIGHLFAGVNPGHGDFCHDQAGAEYLSQYFPPGVTEPVRLHVSAKRYLCTTEAGYIDSLSEASRYSLEHQGGFMTEDEITAFRAEPFYEQAIRLRRWDDEAKDEQLASTPFSSFSQKIAEVCNA